MSKTLCKSKKEYKPPEDPKYECKKCGKVTTKEKKVCKPRKVKS